MEKYYWLILVGVLVIVYVLLIVRQKRQEKRNIETLNSFKVGDKVITHIGIYGRIKRIYNTSFGKTCVLEIGTDKKIDIEMDLRYIAGLDEKVAVADEPAPQNVAKSNKEQKEDAKTENKEETKEQQEEKTEDVKNLEEQQETGTQKKVNNKKTQTKTNKKGKKSKK